MIKPKYHLKLKLKYLFERNTQIRCFTLTAIDSFEGLNSYVFRLRTSTNIALANIASRLLIKIILYIYFQRIVGVNCFCMFVEFFYSKQLYWPYS